jgi:PBSX family phage portal protein
MTKDYVIKSGTQSKQLINQDALSTISGIIEPFFDFEDVLKLYYANVYHRLCINIKSRILSMVEKSDLDKYVQGNTRAFLQECVRDLEIYGNLFVEIAGTQKYKAFYHLPAREARISKEFRVYQVQGFKKQEIEAKQLKYSSPMSRFYGEPDYLSSINNILVNKNIDLYNTLFFENGAIPDLGIIFENSEPSDEQIEAFKTFFAKTFKGVKNAHRTIILSAQPSLDGKDAHIRIEKLSENKDLSFEKLKAINRDDIVAAHNVPPRLVGIVNSGGLGGQGELMGQLHSFNEICIKPKQEIIEEFFAEQLGISIELKSFDVTNFKDDSEVIPQLIQAGIITMNEGREILGYKQMMQRGKNVNDSV